MAYPNPDPCYVLVVDDNEAIREALGFALYRGGFVPLLASCGEDALGFMQGASVPVLIVLDVGLPGMPSSRLLRTIKGDARWARTPVVVISANPKEDVPADMVGDAFLQKPFEVDVLLRIARNVPWGDARRATRSAIRQRGAGQS
jgi:CheY-like chemotaxis protein